MVLLICCWVGYYSIHSVLASLWLKGWVKRHLPGFFPAYRISYNLIAVLFFGVALYYQYRLPDTALAYQPDAIKAIGVLLMVTGGVIALLTFRRYDLKEFLGITAMSEWGEPRLVVGGLNRKVRHPLYTATFIMLGGYLLLSFTRNSLTFAIVSGLYLFIGSSLEEKKLIKLFGEQYRAYQRRVPRFFPFSRRRSE